MQGAIVQIDTREPETIQAIDFEGSLCYPHVLEFGDVHITTPTGETILIERKTPSDLLGSIADNRIFKQVAGMKDITPYVYVVITGILYRSNNDKIQVGGRETGWAWSSVQGALITIQELGATIVYCKNDAEFPKAVEMIATRKRDQEKVLAPTVKARGMSDGEHMLSSLPGVGPQRAIDMMKQFPNPSWALAWLTELNTVSTVSGIGNGTKMKVRKALGLEDQQELKIFDPKVIERKRKAREVRNG